MKVLITGAAGFIGFHLSKSLLIDKYDILGIDNINDYYDIELKLSRLKILESYNNFQFNKIDISNRLDLEKSFKNFLPDIVVNLAAQAGVRYSKTNPYTYMESNLVGFLNIIELCRHNKSKGLIYASSSSVYGGNSKHPSSINDRVDKPISLYGATKRANELIAYSYSHLYKLNTTGLRFFTAYGPWGRPDMAMFIFTKNILEKKSIPIYNNGNMKRDFTYIDDIILGIRSAIDKNYDCEIFNLGNNNSENLMDMIKIIESELGSRAIADFQPIQSGDVIESYADIDYSRKMLNFSPRINIKTGIPKFIDWYKKYFISK